LIGQAEESIKRPAMPEPAVAGVMTRAVVTVAGDTPFNELVGIMIDDGLDAVPVIDATGRPVGMVADVDALPKPEFRCGADTPSLPAGLRVCARWRKSCALTDAEVMTTLIVSIRADVPLRSAVHGLSAGRARQLGVVDDADRLVGVVTRRDALKIFRRGDAAIEDDIEHKVCSRSLEVRVHVTDGIATRAGRLHSMVEHVGRIACGVPGVVAVRNNLCFDFDDLMITEFWRLDPASGRILDRAGGQAACRGCSDTSAPV
jgi:CBS-domain-containing membrane protein